MNTASIKHQYYDPEVYDEFIREEGREGGKQNAFIRMGLKTEVLYNPERDENGNAVDGKTVSAPTGNAPREDTQTASINLSLENEEANKKTEKASQPIREITVNEIVFEVFQNSAKTLYTAKQKDGGPLTAQGKTLKDLNEDLQNVTNI